MYRLSLVLSDTPVHQTKANSDKCTKRICHPIIHVCAAIEGGLDEFDDPTESARTDEDRGKPEPASARKGKGESSKSNEVYKFVASLWCCKRRLKRPEQRDRKNSGNDSGEGNIQKLAHEIFLVGVYEKRKLGP